MEKNLQKTYILATSLQAKESEEDLVISELNMLVQHLVEKNTPQCPEKSAAYEKKIQEKVEALNKNLNIQEYKSHPAIQNLLSFMGDEWLDEAQAKEIIDSMIESNVRRTYKDHSGGHGRTVFKILEHYKKAAFISVDEDLNLERVRMRMISMMCEAGDIENINYVHQVVNALEQYIESRDLHQNTLAMNRIKSECFAARAMG